MAADRRWLLALTGRAPMGAWEGLVFVVAGGGLVLTVVLAGAIPKPDDALVTWTLWWIVVGASAMLFMRGLVGVLALFGDSVRKGFARVRHGRASEPTMVDPHETLRRQTLTEELHHAYWREYIAGHDGITARQMAHNEPAPIWWLDRELSARGEAWNAEDYYQRKPEPDWRTQRLGPIRTYDEGNDVLGVERTVYSEDGDERVILAKGWLSALTNYFPPEAYNQVIEGVEGLHRRPDTKPRAMTAEERLAYFDQLLSDQNPPPPTRTDLEL